MLFRSASVGSLHDPRPTPRRDDELANATRLAMLRHHRREATSLLVVARTLALAGRAGATKDHDRRHDALLLLQQLGLEVLELEAHRPQVVAVQKVDILEGNAVRRQLAEP